MLLVIAGSSFGVRIVVAIVTGSFEIPEREFEFGYEMGKIGEAVASGLGFAWPEPVLFHAPGPTAWMPPIYPLAIGAVFWACGPYTSAAAVVLTLLQVTLSTACCVLLFMLARRLFDVRAGLAAAAMLATYGPAVHFSAQKIWSTDLFVFMLLVVVLLALRLAEHPTRRDALATGGALGLAALVDPMLSAFWLLVLGWLYVRRRRDARTVALIAIASLVVITPWLVRNAVVFDRFVFIKSNFAIDAYMANVVPGTEPTLAWDEVDEMQPRRAYGTELVAWIREHPRDFARKTGARVLRYWTAGTPEASLQARVSVVEYWLLAAAALIGWLVCARSLDPQGAATAQLLTLAVLSLPIPYYVAPRMFALHYRFPVEVLLMTFASGPVAWAWDRGWNAILGPARSRRPVPAPS